MIQQTSILAYEEIRPLLNQRQQEVYDELEQSGTANNFKLAITLGRPINTITPRIHELRKKGLVEEAYKAPCQITGRTTIYWRKR